MQTHQIPADLPNKKSMNIHFTYMSNLIKEKENVNQHRLVLVKCRKDKNKMSEKVKKILNSTCKTEKMT